MRVLLDRHHHALFESMHLTLADRFGFELYAPYGMEWFDEEYWVFEKKFHGDAVAKQYLLGVWGDVRDPWEVAGLIRVDDVRHPDRVLKGVTLARARESEWDLVISSLPHNDEGYHRFAQEVGAVFGVQVGNNVQQSRWDLARFIWSSSTLPGYGPEWVGKRFEYMGTPAVMTHQEFSTDIFRPEWPPAEARSAASFVNCFAETERYPEFVHLARKYADEFDWKCYGSYGSASVDEFAAGDISWVPDVADQMRATRIGIHTKTYSDGFGHVVHQWPAVGRPMVGYARYYADKIAAPLWVEGVTTFDIESRGEHGTIEVMRRLRDDDDFHRRVSEASAARFREVVDFDYEAGVIRDLLEGVV